ncbi:hypothetical protein MNBD_ACTINO01-1930, partial [hydrothermal vent metagenome]
MKAAPTLNPSRLTPADAVRAAGIGLRTRPLRSFLSALGIVIGIAAMVGVLGLSESSKSDLLAQLDQLGTNMLQVEAGTGIGAGSGELPEGAPSMVTRIGPVQAVSSFGTVDANVYRTDYIPPEQTGGIAVLAAGPNLLDTLQGTIAHGVFLDEAPSDYPVTVLGAVAAQRLGVGSLEGAPLVWLGDQWFTVVGIMDSIELSPDIDRSALVGVAAAETYLGY